MFPAACVNVSFLDLFFGKLQQCLLRWRHESYCKDTVADDQPVLVSFEPLIAVGGLWSVASTAFLQPARENDMFVPPNATQRNRSTE